MGFKLKRPSQNTLVTQRDRMYAAFTVLCERNADKRARYKDIEKTFRADIANRGGKPEKP